MRAKKVAAVATHSSRLPLSMPLINPVSLFTAAAWVEAFNFIAAKANERGKVFRTDHRIAVTVEDLYFNKRFESGEFKGFGRAKELLSPFAKVEEWISENNDRNDEFNLLLKLFDAGIKGRLYAFKGAICFSVGGAEATDSSIVSRGVFPHPALQWNPQVEEFLRFLSAVERALMGVGDTICCRAFLRVDFPTLDMGCSIDVRAFLSDIMTEHMLESFGGRTGTGYTVIPPILESHISWTK